MSTEAITTEAPAAAPAAPAATPATPLSAADLAATDAPAAAPTPEGEAAPAAKEEAAPALAMPGKDATPEEWAAFYGQLGRPETPEGYELPLPEGDDGAFAKEMAPILHKHGVTAAQAKGLAEDWNAMVQAQQAQAEAAEAQRLAALDSKNRAEAAELANEWGQANQANMHFAKLAVGQFFPKEKAAGIISAIESQVGYKETIKFLYGIGKGLGEHDAAGMGQPTTVQEKSLAERLYGG